MYVNTKLVYVYVQQKRFAIGECSMLFLSLIFWQVQLHNVSLVFTLGSVLHDIFICQLNSGTPVCGGVSRARLMKGGQIIEYSVAFLHEIASK